jgi:EpsI family protein
LTYWSTIGDQVVVGGIQKKLAEMRYGITGKIADGMLVRVSSIDPDAPRAYKLQAQFAEAMVGAMSVADRARVVGAPKNN